MDVVIIKQYMEYVVGLSRDKKKKILINFNEGMEFPVGQKDHFHKKRKFFMIWISGYQFKLPTDMIRFDNFWWN